MQRLEVSGAVGVKGLTFWCRNDFFVILVYKMRIIQEPNTLKL